MKWTTTLPYTRTTINSRFVKRQTNSRVTCKDSYGKNLTRTNHVISCVREPLNEPPEIHDSQRRDSKLWLTGGENSGANLLRERMNIWHVNSFILMITKVVNMIHIHSYFINFYLRILHIKSVNYNILQSLVINGGNRLQIK